MVTRSIAARSLVLAAALAAPAGWAQDVGVLTDDARRVAAQMQKTLAGTLMSEINSGGPASAIAVCKTIAPSVANDLSLAKGWKVSRVSLRVRNPVLGTPDAWEQRALKSFDERVAKGEAADALEYAEIVSEPGGRYFRYVKALPVAPLCTNCHGTADKIPPAVKERLTAEYPADRATGYEVGQIRGAITVKRPL